MRLGGVSLAAAETGRYQAIVIPEAGRSAGTGSLTTRVFILDTVERHLCEAKEAKGARLDFLNLEL